MDPTCMYTKPISDHAKINFFHPQAPVSYTVSLTVDGGTPVDITDTLNVDPQSNPQADLNLYVEYIEPAVLPVPGY